MCNLHQKGSFQTPLMGASTSLRNLLQVRFPQPLRRDELSVFVVGLVKVSTEFHGVKLQTLCLQLGRPGFLQWIKYTSRARGAMTCCKEEKAARIYLTKMSFTMSNRSNGANTICVCAFEVKPKPCSNKKQ